jgi:hypothetical protein
VTPIALSDSELAEVQAAANGVPYHLRSAFLEQLAVALRGRTLGDGIVHRVAYEVAREVAWGAERVAS